VHALPFKGSTKGWTSDSKPASLYLRTLGNFESVDDHLVALGYIRLGSSGWHLRRAIVAAFVYCDRDLELASRIMLYGSLVVVADS
jgi:hypothetical protein